MLDEEISQSFDLDYEIYSALNGKFKMFAGTLEAPQIKSDDLLKEYENYVKLAKGIFNSLIGLLNSCNSQRMDFRMVLIKMSKDRALIDKLFQEDDDTLVLKKLLIHEELKNKIIDIHLDRIIKNEHTMNTYKNEIQLSKINSINHTISLNMTNNSILRNSIDKNNICFKNKDNERKKSYTFNESSKRNNSTLNSNNVTFNISKNKSLNSPYTASLNNTINDDYALKKMLNLDFNTEKYNISSSPIQTPKTKRATITNNNNNNGNSVNKTPNRKSIGFRKMSDANTEAKETEYKKTSKKRFSKSIDFDTNSKSNFRYRTQENLKYENEYFYDYVNTDTHYQHIENENEELKFFRDGGTKNQNLSKAVNYNNSAKELSLSNKKPEGVNNNRFKIKNNSVIINSYNNAKKGNLKSLIGVAKETLSNRVGNINNSLNTNNSNNKSKLSLTNSLTSTCNTAKKNK